MMKARELVIEIMDDPNLELRLHLQALRGLQRINRWTANAKLAWLPVRDLARSLDRDHLSILDIATGAGDVPIDLCRRAARAGIQLEVEACDVSPHAIELAQKNARRVDAAIRFFQLNALTAPIEREYDVVMCATFLHHLTETQAVALLRTMLAAAQHRVVVVDLVRSRLNWWQVWLASHVLVARG